jgi:hypothetical protein
MESGFRGRCRTEDSADLSVSVVARPGLGPSQNNACGACPGPRQVFVVSRCFGKAARASWARNLRRRRTWFGRL